MRVTKRKHDSKRRRVQRWLQKWQDQAKQSFATIKISAEELSEAGWDGRPLTGAMWFYQQTGKVSENMFDWGDGKWASHAEEIGRRIKGWPL